MKKTTICGWFSQFTVQITNLQWFLVWSSSPRNGEGTDVATTLCGVMGFPHPQSGHPIPTWVNSVTYTYKYIWYDMIWYDMIWYIYIYVYRIYIYIHYNIYIYTYMICSKINILRDQQSRTYTHGKKHSSTFFLSFHSRQLRTPLLRWDLMGMSGEKKRDIMEIW